MFDEIASFDGVSLSVESRFEQSGPLDFVIAAEKHAHLIGEAVILRRLIHPAGSERCVRRCRPVVKIAFARIMYQRVSSAFDGVFVAVQIPDGVEMLARIASLQPAKITIMFFWGGVGLTNIRLCIEIVFRIKEQAKATKLLRAHPKFIAQHP